MNTFLSRCRPALAAGLVVLPTVAPAGEPDAAAPSGRQAVEILHGTRKVWPVLTPAPGAQVPRLPDIPPPAPVAPARADVSAAPGGTESPSRLPLPIVLTGYANPYPVPAPWQAAPVAPPAPPTVVVIREPVAEPRPAAEPARGVTVGIEMLFGIGIGAVGLGFGYAGWNRRRAPVRDLVVPAPLPPAPPPAPPAPPPAPVAPPDNGVLLLGEFNAGPVPTTAEKFDLGQSYQAEQQEKKKVEKQSAEAVLEFILSQNLALQNEFPDLDDDGVPDAIRIDP